MHFVFSNLEVVSSEEEDQVVQGAELHDLLLVTHTVQDVLALLLEYEDMVHATFASEREERVSS